MVSLQKKIMINLDTTDTNKCDGRIVDILNISATATNYHVKGIPSLLKNKNIT